MPAPVQCIHVEDIKTTVDADIGTCRICGQVIHYNGTTDKKTQCVKLGRIGGIPVLPPKHAKLLLSKEDMTILNATLKSTGSMAPVPPRPSSRYQMRQYYYDNKGAILADLELLGKKAMRKHWGISPATWYIRRPDGSTSGLAVRFGIIPPGAASPKTDRVDGKVKRRAPVKVGDRQQLEQPGALKATKVTKVDKSEPKYTRVDKGDHNGLISLGTFEAVAAPDIELPPFPPFDSAWPMLTQIQWLKTYREMVATITANGGHL